MDGPRRLTGQQCLQLMEEMAADQSEDSGETSSDSSSEFEMNIGVVGDTSSDSGKGSRPEPDAQADQSVALRDAGSNVVEVAVGVTEEVHYNEAPPFLPSTVHRLATVNCRELNVDSATYSSATAASARTPKFIIIDSVPDHQSSPATA